MRCHRPWRFRAIRTTSKISPLFSNGYILPGGCDAPAPAPQPGQ
ncbi:hypothetical protein PCL1606_26080 [Pseudomonas chlororaphis]|uniref:Uncharacterized protein n=1 Tax=Pseudomonas chlororaphis TaxID=587753 RepID=A0A0D5XZA7_9PSED|nr:hypothetical protein PCL1606_26080 [Pseudomonas chlororaphis]